MLVVEIVKIGAEMLKLLSKYDIRTDDYEHLPLYEDYAKMLENGDKVTYIVSTLSEKYGIGEATIYRIIKRFSRTIES